MPSDQIPEPARTLYLIVCGAGPATDVATFIRLAHSRDWRVCVVTTPAGATFVDAAELEELTGYPVRTEFRKPGDPEPSWPLADALVVAPATINMVLPIVVAPNVNPALARHPAFQRAVEQLREWGVLMLYERAAPPPIWMASWEQILRELPQRGG